MTAPTTSGSTLTARQQKKLNERINAFREEFQRKLQAISPNSARVAPTPTPRYDGEFTAGVEWLDSLAGDEPPMGKGDVEIGDSVWSAPYRREPDDS